MGAREAKAEADRLLELFRLTDRATADVAALSGGLAQRLMVARSIMHRPAVLFLDEPTAGLDPQSRLGLWDIVRELNGDGQTVLLTTHYMEEADTLCGRVAIMDHGRILALDSPSALQHSVDADTIVTVRVGDADGSDALVVAFGCRRGRALRGARRLRAGRAGAGRGADARALLPRLLAAADGAGVAVDDISVAEPTLETVFIGAHRAGLASDGAAFFALRAARPRGPAQGPAARSWGARSCSRCCCCSCSPTCSRRSGRASVAPRRARRTFSTLLMGGAMATAMMFQGIQAVTLPMVQDFGFTREIEDRVLAPLPVELVALQKVVSAGGAGPAGRAARVPDGASRSRRPTCTST